MLSNSGWLMSIQPGIRRRRDSRPSGQVETPKELALEPIPRFALTYMLIRTSICCIL